MESFDYDSSISSETGDANKFVVSPNTQNQLPQLTTISMMNSDQDSCIILGGLISTSIGDEENTVDRRPMEFLASSNAQNHPPGSITITMVNNSTDQQQDNSSILGGQIAISSFEDEQHKPDRHPTEFQNYRGILYLLYVGFLVVMYPSLTQLLQLKFQNNKQSPFEIQCFFANAAVVAYTIAIPISLVLIYMRAKLETSINKRFSLAYYVYKILKSDFCFFGILAPLSLVLLLLLPDHKSNWIGYSIMMILLVVIAFCNFSDYNIIICNKNVCDLELSKREEAER